MVIHVQPLSGDQFVPFYLIAWKWQDQFWEGVLFARSLQQLFTGSAQSPIWCFQSLKCLPPLFGIVIHLDLFLHILSTMRFNQLQSTS